MDIIPDITVFIQIVQFLFLLFVLNMIFYRPIRRILSQRSDKEKDLYENIEGFRKKSDQYLKDLEENYKGARGEGFKEKDILKQAGTETEKEILQGIGELNEINVKPYVAIGYLLLGDMYVEEGRQEQGQENLRRAEQMFQEMEMGYWLNRTKKILAES